MIDFSYLVETLKMMSKMFSDVWLIIKVSTRHNQKTNQNLPKTSWKLLEIVQRSSKSIQTNRFSPSCLSTVHISKCKLTNAYIAFCFEVLGSDLSTYTSDFTTLVLVINALVLRVGTSYRVLDGDCSMSTLSFTVVLKILQLPSINFRLVGGVLN